jgi:hypothetical protein
MIIARHSGRILIFSNLELRAIKPAKAGTHLIHIDIAGMLAGILINVIFVLDFIIDSQGIKRCGSDYLKKPRITSIESD